MHWPHHWKARCPRAPTIRYATRALDGSSSPLRDVIAHHNLCLAWRMQGDGAKAESHCRAASTLEEGKVAAKPIRAGFNRGYYQIAAPGSDVELEDLAALIATNLLEVGFDADAQVVLRGGESATASPN